MDIVYKYNSKYLCTLKVMGKIELEKRKERQPARIEEGEKEGRIQIRQTR